MLRFVGPTLQRKHFLNAKTGLIFHLKGHALKTFFNLVKKCPRRCLKKGLVSFIPLFTGNPLF